MTIMKIRFLTATVLGVLILSGCSTMEWTKQGASEEQTAADLSDCRQHARVRSYHDANVQSAIPAGKTAAEIEGRAVRNPGVPAGSNSFMVEQGLTQDCMMQRGYALTSGK